MKKLYSENPFKNLETAMKDLQDLVDAMPQQLAAAKDLNEIKSLMPIKRCTVLGQMRSNIDDYWRVGRDEHPTGENQPTPTFSWGSIWRKPNWLDEKEILGCVDNAKWHLDALKKHGEYIHTQNRQALSNNIMLRERLANIMAIIGIPKTQNRNIGQNRNRKPQTESSDSGWVTDMLKYIPINDGHSDLQAQYNKQLQHIAEWEKAKMDALKNAEVERIKTEDYQKAMSTIATLKVKYALELDATPNDVVLYLENLPLVRAYLYIEDFNDDNGGFDVEDVSFVLNLVGELLDVETRSKFTDWLNVDLAEAMDTLRDVDDGGVKYIAEYDLASHAKYILEKRV